MAGLAGRKRHGDGIPRREVFKVTFAVIAKNHFGSGCPEYHLTAER
jgi:hypothetical protein